MRDKIVQLLDQIQKEKNITIFYACESGSRAWGFESKDSDYDVRFLYYHSIDWYLSIQKRKDNIGGMTGSIDEVYSLERIDYEGWDLRKALYLLGKSNPSLIEWLNSPIVYRADSIADEMCRLKSKCYSRRACHWHYYHMALGNYREYLKSDIVKLKKYFYVIRPILACRWLEKFGSSIPVRFNDLSDATMPNEVVAREVFNLLERKRDGEELEEGPKQPILNMFIEHELYRLSRVEYERRSSSDGIINYALLNKFFREVVLD